MRFSTRPSLFPLARRGTRWRTWAWAAVAATAGHVWLLADSAHDQRLRRVGAEDDRVPVLWARRVEAGPTVYLEAAGRTGGNTSQVARAAPVQTARPAGPRARQATPSGAPPDPAAGSAAADTAEPAPARTLAPPAGHDAPTTYPTRLPPPFSLAFEVTRAGMAGTGELRFDVGAEGYELNLQMQTPGREAMGLSSRGHIDANGLAPDRHATLRRGRERQAAHFDRDAQRITYSGPQIVNELQPGTQDRLSWMVQLPAIVDADPASFGAGTRVRVPVSGARGDAAIWVFVVQGREGAWLHLVREAARPYDTRAEVWLDPSRHHLPVRVSLSHAPARDVLELNLAAPHSE